MLRFWFAREIVGFSSAFTPQNKGSKNEDPLPLIIFVSFGRYIMNNFYSKKILQRFKKLQKHRRNRKRKDYKGVKEKVKITKNQEKVI